MDAISRHDATRHDIRWTLERLHLCECPPRFPKIFFAFAYPTSSPASVIWTVTLSREETRSLCAATPPRCRSDELSGATAARRLARVAAILRRHPALRLRIEGFAQSNAPPSLGRAVAQARAAAVRRALLLEHLPRDEAPWRDEDANDGVREGGYDESSEAADSGLGLGLVDFYRPRAIGRALQAGSNDVARKDLVSSQLQVTAITTAAAGRRQMGVRPAADGTAQRKL